MKIEYRDGDMFKAPERVLLHGCNAQGVMRSGVAKAMREIYPGAYDAYAVVYRHFGLKLGEVIWHKEASDGRIIANAITQDRFGRDGSRYVDYTAVRDALRAVDLACAMSQSTPSIPGQTPMLAVVMPLIGAGLGGGSWEVIAAIIEETSGSFQPIVYLHDGKMPTT